LILGLSSPLVTVVQENKIDFLNAAIDAFKNENEQLKKEIDDVIRYACKNKK
jgi:hypothetical protein